MREHVAIEWIERRIVEVRCEDAFFQVVEDDHGGGPTQPPKRALVELTPDRRARLPREQPRRLPRVREREEKQARAAVLPRLGAAHHRPVAVIDLSFLAGRRRNDDARLGRGRAAEFRHESSHAGVPGREPMVIDQVLPDRHRIPPAGPCGFDQLAIGLADAFFFD